MNRSDRETAAAKVRGVYLLTPDAQASEFERLLTIIEGALREGVTAIQYRNKIASQEQRESETRRIVGLAHTFGAIVIVNDDPELATRCSADGAHVGRDDTFAAAARIHLGSALLGVSCYTNLDLAARALEAGADVIAFGSVFSSRTKPNAVPAPLSILARARTRFPSARVVAIGGIEEGNIAEVGAAGAHAAALISAVFSATNPRTAVRRLTDNFLEGQARYESQRTPV